MHPTSSNQDFYVKALSVATAGAAFSFCCFDGANKTFQYRFHLQQSHNISSFFLVRGHLCCTFEGCFVKAGRATRILDEVDIFVKVSNDFRRKWMPAVSVTLSLCGDWKQQQQQQQQQQLSADEVLGGQYNVAEAGGSFRKPFNRKAGKNARK
jgi:hypothetical protein